MYQDAIEKFELPVLIFYTFNVHFKIVTLFWKATQVASYDTMKKNKYSLGTNPPLLVRIRQLRA